MSLIISQQKAWKQEYDEKQSIESSATNRPEACITWFRNWLNKQNIIKGRLLDLGCGLGRNSIPFLKHGWSVTAQDIVPSALKRYNKKASLYPGKLILKEQSLEKKLPYQNNLYQAAMEITVADNLLDIKKQNQLWQEVSRVLRPGGYFLSYYFTYEDGFYGKLFNQQKPINKPIVYDAKANMHFRFYNAADIVRGSQGFLQVWKAKHYRYPGPMHGKVVDRDLVAVIFKNVKFPQL